MKRAVRKDRKERLSTTSNDSSPLQGSPNQNSNFENPSRALSNLNEDSNQANSHFFLRKRKKINYSLTRPDFLYESLSDSDYEETHSKKYINVKERNKRRKNKGGSRKEGTANPFKKNMSPAECREFQLKSLLNWKNFPIEPAVVDKECKVVTVDDVLSCNLEKYCKDLECILINPPWSPKNPKFDFAKFSKINLPFKCMKEGLIFIWVERDLMADVIGFFEDKGIRYVENLIWIKLNPKAQSSTF